MPLLDSVQIIPNGRYRFETTAKKLTICAQIHYWVEGRTQKRNKKGKTLGFEILPSTVLKTGLDRGMNILV